LSDTANVIVRPPLALLVAFLAGLGLDWLYRLNFLPMGFPRIGAGGLVFVAGLVLFACAITTIRAAGTEVQTSRPTTAITSDGPYRFTRNPIYTAMMLALLGAAIGFNTLWILVALVLFYFVIRYGVIAREEAYLARKFGGTYSDYQSRVRRWL